jgi:hypothetical protein
MIGSRERRPQLAAELRTLEQRTLIDQGQRRRFELEHLQRRRRDRWRRSFRSQPGQREGDQRAQLLILIDKQDLHPFGRRCYARGSGVRRK